MEGIPQHPQHPERLLLLWGPFPIIRIGQWHQHASSRPCLLASVICISSLPGCAQAELKEVRRTGFWNILSNCIFSGGPILISLASFAVFIFLGHDLTPDVAFPALALFNLLRFPVLMCALVCGMHASAQCLLLAENNSL